MSRRQQGSRCNTPRGFSHSRICWAKFEMVAQSRTSGTRLATLDGERKKEGRCLEGGQSRLYSGQGWSGRYSCSGTSIIFMLITSDALLWCCVFRQLSPNFWALSSERAQVGRTLLWRRVHHVC